MKLKSGVASVDDLKTFLSSKQPDAWKKDVDDSTDQCYQQFYTSQNTKMHSISRN